MMKFKVGELKHYAKAVSKIVSTKLSESDIVHWIECDRNVLVNQTLTDTEIIDCFKSTIHGK